MQSSLMWVVDNQKSYQWSLFSGLYTPSGVHCYIVTLLHCFFFRVTPTLGSTLWQNGPSFQLAGVSKWLMAFQIFPLMCIFDIWFTIVEFILNSLFEKQISCWTSYPYIMIMSKLPKLQLRTRNCQNYRHSVFWKKMWEIFLFSKFVF